MNYVKIIHPAPRPGHSRSLQGARGFGLIELMVAMVIALVILAALVALFIGTSRNNREMATANSVIDNGRFAIQLLESDLVHAGFWGTHVPRYDDQTSDAVPADVPGSVPDPCLAYDVTNWNNAYTNSLIGTPVQVYEDAAVCTGVVTNKVAASDILVVRHAELCVPGVGGCEADTNGKLYIQSSLCTTDLNAYAFGPTGSTTFPLLRRNCTTAAEKRKFVSHIYWVRNFAVTAGDGIPTLVRSEFDLVSGTLAHQPPVALIEGIDAMRIEIGVDDVSRTGGAVNYTQAVQWDNPATRTAAVNRGDGIPDGAFVRCTTLAPCDIGDFMNATAVRVYLLARSRETTPGYTDTKIYTLGSAGTVGPFNDGFKRHVYSTTVRLINVSGRRERP